MTSLKHTLAVAVVGDQVEGVTTVGVTVGVEAKVRCGTTGVDRCHSSNAKQLTTVTFRENPESRGKLKVASYHSC